VFVCLFIRLYWPVTECKIIFFEYFIEIISTLVSIYLCFCLALCQLHCWFVFCMLARVFSSYILVFISVNVFVCMRAFVLTYESVYGCVSVCV